MDKNNKATPDKQAARAKPQAKPPKSRTSWIRPYTDVKNSIKPVVTSVRTSSGFIQSIVNRIKGIRSDVGAQQKRSTSKRKGGTYTFKDWLQSEIDNQGFTSVDDLNDKLMALTDTSIGTAKIGTYLFTGLTVILLVMLIWAGAGFFGWFNGAVWFVVGGVLMMQARFRAWWLLRKVAGVSFKSWLFSKQAFDPLIPLDYTETPYVATDFVFPVAPAVAPAVDTRDTRDTRTDAQTLN